MRTRIEYNTLIFYMEGRIDSGTASLMEQEMSAAVESAPNAEIILDAENLDYISSAGLRALMKLRKFSEKPIKVTGVSPEIWNRS